MNIMFICTGNICRSAMADGLMKKAVGEKSLNINVCSAGIYAETGEHATYNAVAVMKEYDVDIALHKATNIEESKIEEMDLILCATNQHKRQIIAQYSNLKDKVYTIKEYAGYDKHGVDVDIKDPWGYDINTYRMCAAEISYCIDKIIEQLEQKGQ